MYITLKRTWHFAHGYSGELPSVLGITFDHLGRSVVPAGTYEAERIPCPVGHNCNWIVIKGTLIGIAEGALRDWEGEEWGDFEIILED